MKGEWCFFGGHFTADQCDTILNNGLSVPVKDASVGVGGQVRPDHAVRRSAVRFLQQTDTRFDWVFRELWHLAMWANRDWFDFHLTSLNYVQLAEYKAENAGEYKRHQDVFWITDQPTHRKLSCVVQLSDPADYAGGRLELYDVGGPFDPEKILRRGTVVFFPSFVYHAALPVTRGTRHSLAAWFDGPKWR